jgi:formylglycine-generating enzyme required for sulfatase activity
LAVVGVVVALVLLNMVEGPAPKMEIVAEADAAEAARKMEIAAKAEAAEAARKAALALENGLGMRFVPVGGTGVLFSVWETRVRDYRAFCDGTGQERTEGTWTLGKDQWKQRGESWKGPGFVQGGTHPVVGVSWEDAKAFCVWLTEKERGEGKIGSEQRYRLPTDAEWSAAVGGGKYPWGNEWPPPGGSGNYAGEEAKDSRWPDEWGTLKGFSDGFARTSPAGSFAANRHGLYDMGGNVWEWCEDWYKKEMNTQETLDAIPVLKDDEGGSTYKVVRGGSWRNIDPDGLASSYRSNFHPVNRNAYGGFRCVLVGRGSSP